MYASTSMVDVGQIVDNNEIYKSITDMDKNKIKAEAILEGSMIIGYYYNDDNSTNNKLATMEEYNAKNNWLQNIIESIGVEVVSNSSKNKGLAA